MYDIVISDHYSPIENAVSDRIWRMKNAHLLDSKCINYVKNEIHLKKTLPLQM